MIELGRREDCSGTDTLKDLGPSQKLQAFNGYSDGEPAAFPEMIGDQVLIGGYLKVRKERTEYLVLCENLKDMEFLHDEAELGAVLDLTWYVSRNHDLTTVLGVVAYMYQSKSQDEWDARSREVKAANGGEYPDFWFEKVISPDLRGKAERFWSTSPDSSSRN